jgi:hypothetical protein
MYLATGKTRRMCNNIIIRRNTNKMQLCNRIYYSRVYWRLNMFRGAHRSSSEDLNYICSLWFIYPCGDWPLSRLSLDNGRSPHGYINQRLQTEFKVPDDERETCWAFNKLWNNKFYYKAASCWYFYWVITMHGYMSIRYYPHSMVYFIYSVFVVHYEFWTYFTSLSVTACQVS